MHKSGMTLYSSKAAAYSRLVTEGLNGQTANQARNAGLKVREVRQAVELHRCKS